MKQQALIIVTELNESRIRHRYDASSWKTLVIMHKAITTLPTSPRNELRVY